MEQNNNLEYGIALAKLGEKKKAAVILARAVQSDPKSAQAWYWLGMVIDDLEKKRYCLERARALEPAPVQPKVSDSIKIKEAVETISYEQALGEGLFDPNETSSVKNSPQPSSETNKLRVNPKYFLIGIILVMVAIGFPIMYDVLTNPKSSLFTNTSMTVTAEMNHALAVLSPIPTDTPYITIVPPLSLQDRINAKQPSMQAAEQEVDQENYSDAIVLLTDIINDVPEYADAYFYRGFSYLKIIDSLHNESEYVEYLQKSIQDFDEAINLDPTVPRYYRLRASSIWAYGQILPMSADRMLVYQTVLENFQKAQRLYLPDTNYETNSNMASLYVDMGYCQQSLEMVDQVENTETLTDDNRNFLLQVKADASFCLGNYANAYAYSQSIIRCNRCNQFFQSEVLYSQGKQKEALELLNQSIEEDPNYTGERYYLRALIYIDQGNYDQAENDLSVGEGMTWGRTSTYGLVKAYLAYHDDNTSDGNYWLQYAQAALRPDDGPALSNRIASEMETRGVRPLKSTPDVYIYSTPIP